MTAFSLGGKVAVVTGASRASGWRQDVADLALYLAFPASDYATGAVFLVDGGMNVASAMV